MHDWIYNICRHTLNIYSNWRFKVESLLQSHVYTVHREKKFKHICEICGKKFHAKYFLDQHKLSHIDHSDRLTEKKQCEHCGVWLLTKGGIFYHQQIHTTGEQQCTVCNLKFPHKPALLEHNRQHHRKLKYKCSHCDKAFDIKSKLRVMAFAHSPVYDIHGLTLSLHHFYTFSEFILGKAYPFKVYTFPDIISLKRVKIIWRKYETVYISN